MPKYLPPLMFLLLAACGGGGGGEGEPANEPAAAKAEEVPVANATRDPSDSGQASTSVVASQPVVWIGRFAASAGQCAGGAWTFDRTQVKMGGGRGCSVNNIAEDPGSVKLLLSCSGDGIDSLETWTLTPKGDKGVSVLREGKSKPVTVDLVRCG
jgi:hypothetical protein